ncbi:MAG: hypothetical protein NTV07_04060 [Candidatus Omnitrophica bacterium]|nr:hypothetical protein [Candidatus Omnitrophota bacterium]
MEKTKTSMAIAAIIFVSLLSIIGVFKDTISNYSKCHIPDDITLYESRFNAVKTYLPKQGVIGYISDRKAEDIRFAGVETARYYLSQYALAPVVVDYNVNHPFVLGNFTGSFDRAQMQASKGLLLIKDFGNGVVLFKKAG